MTLSLIALAAGIWIAVSAPDGAIAQQEQAQPIAQETTAMNESTPQPAQGESTHGVIPSGFAATPGYDGETDPTSLRIATFGGGCFWGVESTFRGTAGVTHTAVGFSGGTRPDPSYKDVCYTDTGHAEVVQLLFDPSVVTYEELLEVFWNAHDPTQLNRQGPDVGSQYRSVIFTHDDDQREAASASLTALQRSPKFQGRKIVTQIEPASSVYLAEDYHQQYLEKRGQSSCHVPGR